jgi:hypothetical protein
MMVRVSGVLVASALVAVLASTATASASSGPAPVVIAQAADREASTGRSRKRSEARSSKKEPTASQMAARERQKKCSAEWKSAKSAGNVTGGMKWPKFWSQCNARLKGNSA